MHFPRWVAACVRYTRIVCSPSARSSVRKWSSVHSVRKACLTSVAVVACGRDQEAQIDVREVGFY